MLAKLTCCPKTLWLWPIGRGARPLGSDRDSLPGGHARTEEQERTSEPVRAGEHLHTLFPTPLAPHADTARSLREAEPASHPPSLAGAALGQPGVRAARLLSCSEVPALGHRCDLESQGNPHQSLPNRRAKVQTIRRTGGEDSGSDKLGWQAAAFHLRGCRGSLQTGIGSSLPGVAPGLPTNLEHPQEPQRAAAGSSSAATESPCHLAVSGTMQPPKRQCPSASTCACPSAASSQRKRIGTRALARNGSRTSMTPLEARRASLRLPTECPITSTASVVCTPRGVQPPSMPASVSHKSGGAGLKGLAGRFAFSGCWSC